jgi:SAM-dependent methyltransferase
MDGINLQYPDRSFDVVIERASLHHISGWEKALEEMARVSAGYVLIEEPVADLRSAGKRNAAKAQTLFLELQDEVKYPHFSYIAVPAMVNFLKSRGLSVQYEIIRSDGIISFEEFFSGFDQFAEKSSRPEYWKSRLKYFQAELGNGLLVENDTVFIEAVKNREA